eukprot:GFUD01026920.1.p1 GENE.GFUD01026920.1~~GFUD01026920.1.p1  ORF type:complete len:384 (+),score=99.22 GFUD01026920.1:49-1152(+)
MGCMQSTEGVVHDQGGGASTSQGAVGGAASGSQVGISVPAVPGWDGRTISTLPMSVEIIIKIGWNGVDSSMDLVNSTIHAQNTAGAGYRLAAVFLPLDNHNKKRRGKPVDYKAVGFGTISTRVMCIFQADRQGAGQTLETMFLQAPMTVRQSATWSLEDMKVEGCEQLYGQLGQAGNTGFQLSCVVDEPNNRCSGFFSTQTSVHLVCQKPLGAQSPVPAYTIANIPIVIKHGWGGTTASMPLLASALTAFTTTGYKVASVYNPPSVTLKGFLSTETQCHIIMMKTPVNYYFAICDVPFFIKYGWRGSTVDHTQYLNIISAYAAQGWELGGLIDLPDVELDGFTSIKSTIKLIFQAPANEGGVGGNLI